MPSPIDLYNHAYRGHTSDVYRDVRVATYGRDFGQTSWVTTEESNTIPRLLQISSSSNVLEIGFGSGLYAIHLAETTGCRITGVELNPHAVTTATQLAGQHESKANLRFLHHDVTTRLPFQDGAFDAVFSNDVFCHIPDRLYMLREVHRVLRPGGKLLFSDALIIAAPVTNTELATRASIGLYVFTAPGNNEQLLAQSGFHLESATDTTANAALIAERWHAAREAQTPALLDIEGEENYAGLQRFLSCVARLTSENRLLRYLYVASRNGERLGLDGSDKTASNSK